MSRANPNNPTAVVTGASSGFGAAITERLLSNGWNVSMIARSTDKMKEIASKYIDDINDECRVKIIKCDVLISSEIINSCKIINKWSNNKINLLVNNVGGLKGDAGFENTTTKDLQYAFDINLKSTFLFTQQLIESIKNGSKYILKKDNKIYDGSIINIDTLATKVNEIMDIPYQITKSGQQHLTKITALYYSKYKVRVNGLSPSVIPTPIHIKMMGKEALPQFYGDFKKITPLNEIGKIKDLVEVVQFLSEKNKSGWITGHIFNIDGGLSLVSALSLTANL